MKDIQKIKEFFSKPLGEVKKDEYGNHLEPQFKKGDKVTYLGHPAEITAVNKEMGGTYSYSVEYDKGQGKTKASNLKNKGGEIKMVEAMTTAYESKEEYTVAGRPVTLNKGKKSNGTDWTVTFLTNSSMGRKGEEIPLSDVLALIKPFPKGITMNEAESISDYKVGDVLNLKDGETWKVIKLTSNGGVLAAPFGKTKDSYISIAIEFPAHILKNEVVSLNEAKEEDAVDTITMDIPLFLRMLEYSREDAEQDLDLHDVTEKANKLGKERGILSMDDYEEIVGAAEEIKEEQLSFISKARAKSSLRQFLSGKRDDGMGKFDAIVYGIDSDGNKHQIKYYNDLQNYEKFALGDNPDFVKEAKNTSLDSETIKQIKDDIKEFPKYQKRGFESFKKEVRQRYKITPKQLEDILHGDLTEGMRGELDEPFFIEVSVRDARKALDLFQDQYRNSNIGMYGSNVYAADTPEDIYDLYYDLISQDIEILDANVEYEDYDYDSEYEKTLAETILRKLKNSFKK